MNTKEKVFNGSSLWQKRIASKVYEMQMLIVNGGSLGKIEVSTFLNGEVGLLHDTPVPMYVWRVYAKTYGVSDGNSKSISSPLVYSTEREAWEDMDKFVEQHIRTRIDE